MQSHSVVLAGHSAQINACGPLPPKLIESVGPPAQRPIRQSFQKLAADLLVAFGCRRRAVSAASTQRLRAGPLSKIFMMVIVVHDEPHAYMTTFSSLSTSLSARALPHALFLACCLRIAAIAGLTALLSASTAVLHRAVDLIACVYLTLAWFSWHMTR